VSYYVTVPYIIRLHLIHQMRTKLQPVFPWRDVSVCQPEMCLRPAKAAKRIKILFGVKILGGTRNIVSHGGPIAREGGFDAAFAKLLHGHLEHYYTGSTMYGQQHMLIICKTFSVRFCWSVFGFGRLQPPLWCTADWHHLVNTLRKCSTSLSSSRPITHWAN